MLEKNTTCFSMDWKNLLKTETNFRKKCEERNRLHNSLHAVRLLYQFNKLGCFRGGIRSAGVFF